jgi:outer membrane lipoprotein-sorting protein
MHRARKLAYFALVALILLPARAMIAADELQTVLNKLDSAAARFHSTEAHFKFDTELLDPVPDTDIQEGTVYYQRNGTAFKMAAHIDKVNGKAVTRVYSYAGGVLALYDQPANQVTRFSKASQYESYLMLGFGASGKDLGDKWEIKYLGPESVDGVKTEKLELVAKDAAVRKNITKVTIWVDTERAVSLKQRFDEGPSTYRICTYSNFKTNQPLPGDAFTFKTDSQTTFSNR